MFRTIIELNFVSGCFFLLFRFFLEQTNRYQSKGVISVFSSPLSGARSRSRSSKILSPAFSTISSSALVLDRLHFLDSGSVSLSEFESESLSLVFGLEWVF